MANIAAVLPDATADSKADCEDAVAAAAVRSSDIFNGSTVTALSRRAE